MSFTLPFLHGSVFFWTALSCSGDYQMERSGMPSPDAVGINNKNGATTENQGAGSCISAMRCMFDYCVCVI